MNVFELFAKLSLNTDDYESKLKSAKSMTGTFSRGLMTAARVGTVAVTKAAQASVGFAKDAVKAGESFDSAMAGVAATLGKSIDDMVDEIGTADTAYGEFTGNLRDFALFLGSNTAFSATQAAEALNYMALAGYDTQESMNMLPIVLDMAAAGSMDLARASDMVTDTQSALGLTAERTALMVDEFAKAASTGNTSVEQLGDAFLTVGGLAQELNGGMVTLSDGTVAAVDGVQELEIALTAMANAGIKGSEAGTHMRNMLLKLSSPSESGANALKSLGVAVFDDEGKMRSLNSIFSDMQSALDGNVLPSFQNFYNQMAAMGDEEILKQFEKAPEDFDFFGVSIVDAEGHLKDFLSVYAEAQEYFADGLTQKETVQAFADMFNVRDLSAAEAILNSVGGDWDRIGESILNAEGAASQMAETKLDTLSGSITIFKSALEGAQITISDVLSPSLKSFVEFGTQSVSDLTNAFEEDGLSGAIEVLGEIISTGLTNLIEKAPDFTKLAITFLGKIGEGLIENLPKIAETVTQIIGLLVPVVIESLPKVLDGIVTSIITILPQVIQAAKTIFDAIVELLPKLAIDILKALPTTIKTILDGIKKVLPELLNTLSEVLQEILPVLFETLSEILPEILKSAAEILPQLIENIIMLISDNLPIIIQGLIDVISAIVESMPDIINSLITALPTIIKLIVSVITENLPIFIQGITEIILKITEQLPTIINSIIEVMPTLIESIITAITELLPLIIETGRTLFISLIHELPQITKSITEKLPDLIQGIIDGIIASLPDIIECGIELFVSLISDLPAIIEGIVVAVPKIIEGLVNEIGDWYDYIVEKGSEMLLWLIENLPEIIEDVKTAIGDIVTAIGKKISSLADTLLELGGNIAKGIYDGLVAGVEWIVDNVGDLFGDIVDGVADFFGIASPSKLFRDKIGKNLALGIEVGFADEIDEVTEGIKSSIPMDFEISENVRDRNSKSNEDFQPIVINIENINGISDDNVNSFSANLSETLYSLVLGEKVAVL